MKLFCDPLIDHHELSGYIKSRLLAVGFATVYEYKDELSLWSDITLASTEFLIDVAFTPVEPQPAGEQLPLNIMSIARYQKEQEWPVNWPHERTNEMGRQRKKRPDSLGESEESLFSRTDTDGLDPPNEDDVEALVCLMVLQLMPSKICFFFNASINFFRQKCR